MGWLGWRCLGRHGAVVIVGVGMVVHRNLLGAAALMRCAPIVIPA
jgi:hypothetical protein